MHALVYLFLYKRDKIDVDSDLHILSGSSRQGVGTVHASSNFAASHHYESYITCVPQDWLPAVSQALGQTEIAAKPITRPILPQATPRNPRRTYLR